jgi:hypothetical protein
MPIPTTPERSLRCTASRSTGWKDDIMIGTLAMCAAFVLTWLLTAFPESQTTAASNHIPVAPPRQLGDSANPDLQGGCGIDVALVLDASGSIGEAGAIDLVVAAAQAYVDGLTGSDSRAAVVNFNSTAVVAAEYQPVTADSATAGGTHWMAIHDGQPNGYQVLATAATGSATNWEGGLAAVASLGAPELVVFVTDGRPTAWLDETGAAVEVPPPITAQEVSDARRQAEPAAEALRAAGSHLIGVAVGALTGEVTVDNYQNDPPPALQLLSGLIEPASENLGVYFPSASGEAATFDVASDDIVIVRDFKLLGTRLRELATSQCASPTPPPEMVPPDLAPTGPDQTVVLGALGLAALSVGIALSLLSSRRQPTNVRADGRLSPGGRQPHDGT